MNLQEKDFKYVWHPYTQMKDCETNPPLVIKRAEGAKLFDEEDNFYYDTISSWWCNIHGHNHPKIVKAINEQLKKLDHTLFAGFTHEPAILLAEKLVEITPPHFTKVFYSDNGSTAVEVALKMSLQYWSFHDKPKRTKFVSLDYGYHGDTVGTMSVSGVDLFNEVFQPLFFDSFKAKTPYNISVSEALLDLEDILKNHHDELAAFILEPLLMGAGGMIIYPKEYLEKAAELCKQYNIHLIVDEVATGFGRTGKMFAIEHCDQTIVQPDFICISKGVTSGTLPLAVTLTTDAIYETFYDDYENKKTFYHGHTYTANPIACAVGLATLKIFKDEDVLNKIIPITEQLAKGLERFSDLGVAIRQLGMVAAIELDCQKFSFKDRIGYHIYQAGLKENIILRPLGNVVYLYLPLCLTADDLEFILDKTYKVVKQYA
ncbi:MAG: adenosylmethionine--8-amino-7-oxononanoate transaminase [bacterium]|nr:adenosylmethionine--8-amino-7-oxononanoate transaminase [bacterium]